MIRWSSAPWADVIRRPRHHRLNAGFTDVIPTDTLAELRALAQPFEHLRLRSSEGAKPQFVACFA